MDQESVVIVDDDDEDVIVADDGYHSRTSSAVDTIIIDEDVEDDVIEVKDEPHRAHHRAKNSMLMGNLTRLSDPIYKDNKLLEQFVHTCFSLENSDTMLRIVNRSLLKAYRSTSEAFKQSNGIHNILENALKLLTDDPSCKYSPIKYVCDKLNRHKEKRRVNLITLTTDLGNNSKAPELSNCKNLKLRRAKTHTICDKDDNIPTISLDDDENAMVIDDIINKNSNKENCDMHQLLANNNESNSNDNNVALSMDTPIEATNLLIPHKDAEFTETNDLERIKEIERLIEEKKQRIAKFDMCEVTIDSVHSPYLQSERLKKEVVELYKTLCQLVGEQPVKRHEVRLKMMNDQPNEAGRRQVHVHKLEAFLNRNIGSNGDPPFPDFDDVVRCVRQGNDEEGLGWSNVQIMREANMLFTQCGRALQRRRQRREWRDLLGLLNADEADLDDPAEQDPELLAKLEANKRIAVAKENDILERFSNMEKSLPPLMLNPNILAESESENGDIGSTTKLDTQILESNSDILVPKPSLGKSQSSVLNEDTEFFDDIVKESSTLPESSVVQIKTEPEDIPALLENLGSEYTMSIDIEDPLLVIEISDSEYETDED